MRKDNGLAWFNILFGALLYIGAFYVSYAHTLDLMHRAHYVKQYAHIITLVGEGVFILGMVNLVVLQIKGKKIGILAPPRLALWAGLIIVGYSNWSSGWGKGAESIAVGIGIVVVMWVAESVMSYGIKETRSNKHRTVGIEQSNNQTPNTSDQTHSNNQTEDETIEEISIKRTRPKQTSNTQTVEQSNIPTLFEIESNKHQTLESNTFDKTIKQSNINQTVSEQSDSQTPKIKQSSNNRINPLLDESNSEVFDIVFQLQDQTGKLPSIRKLADVADISTYRSKQVLDKIKQSNTNQTFDTDKQTS